MNKANALETQGPVLWHTLGELLLVLLTSVLQAVPVPAAPLSVQLPAHAPEGSGRCPEP